METLVATARRVLAAGPPLRLAVLFGSQATGRARQGSDVDIAILPCDPDLALKAELELAGALSSALGREVDLLRLDRAATLLRWEIARHGTPLVTSSHEWPRFRASAASEHAEIAEALEHAARLFQRRLLRPAT
ncbi:MAG: nucleotidyltransferase domain-containing protein [Myxococcales bacterium]|nr:nucleotidyltransferase domain-containing protein [Myxococcales bacterium]